MRIEGEPGGGLRKLGSSREVPGSNPALGLLGCRRGFLTRGAIARLHLSDLVRTNERPVPASLYCKVRGKPRVWGGRSD
jgi:hypothetical protein